MHNAEVHVASEQRPTLEQPNGAEVSAALAVSDRPNADACAVLQEPSREQMHSAEVQAASEQRPTLEQPNGAEVSAALAVNDRPNADAGAVLQEPSREQTHSEEVHVASEQRPTLEQPSGAEVSAALGVDDRPKVDAGAVLQESSREQMHSAEENVAPEQRPTLKQPNGTEVSAALVVDDRPKVDACAVHVSKVDATLNVMASRSTATLSSLHASPGFQYLFAGARANVGIKAGKYMFEVSVLEVHSNFTNRHAKPCLRVGFSVARSPLLMERSHNISFDFNGSAVVRASDCPLTSAPAIRKGMRSDLVIGILLDMDSKSVSAYLNGACVRPAQKLPASFEGRSLYPTFTYRNVTLQVNFGPNPRYTDHRMLGDAAKEDIELAPSEDTRCQVVFPVGLPNQGVFTWVDEFIESNPSFTELSNRMILSWLKKSIEETSWPENSSCGEERGPFSADRPNLQLVHPDFNIVYVGTTLGRLATALKRNFVVMELISNLTGDGRRHILGQNWAWHQKKAIVLLRERVDEDMAKFSCQGLPDASEEDVATNCAQFSLPSAEEGFDEIRYEFETEDACAELLRRYITGVKQTISVFVKPSEQFVADNLSSMKKLFGMKAKQGMWREKNPKQTIPDDLDTEHLSNIEDVPLYANFEFEDWYLLQFRFQVHLLLVAFKRDVEDLDSQHIHKNTFASHYANFYGKFAFEAGEFNKTDLKEALELINDTVVVDSSTGLLEHTLGDDASFEQFVKHTYIARRNRLQLIDAGLESANLNFPRKYTRNLAQQEATERKRQQALFKKDHSTRQQMPPAMNPGMKPALKPAMKPALKPAKKLAKLAVKSVLKPAMKSALKPAMKPAMKPALKPAMKPAMKPMQVPTLAAMSRVALQYAAANMRHAAAPLSSSTGQMFQTGTPLLSSAAAVSTSPTLTPLNIMMIQQLADNGRVFFGSVKRMGSAWCVNCEEFQKMFGITNITVRDPAVELKGIPEDATVSFTVKWNSSLQKPFAVNVSRGGHAFDPPLKASSFRPASSVRNADAQQGPYGTFRKLSAYLNDEDVQPVEKRQRLDSTRESRQLSSSLLASTRIASEMSSKLPAPKPSKKAGL